MFILVLLISLFLTLPAFAGDLGTAGAFSGFGQGMGQGLSQMQSGIIQQGLMNQRQSRELEYLRQESEAVLAEQREVNNLSSALTAERRRLDALRETDPAQFQRELPAHNQSVYMLNARVARWENRNEALRARFRQ